MEAKLIFKYDREGDILYTDKRPPFAEQESEELGDEKYNAFAGETGRFDSIKRLGQVRQ